MCFASNFFYKLNIDSRKIKLLGFLVGEIKDVSEFFGNVTVEVSILVAFIFLFFYVCIIL